MIKRCLTIEWCGGGKAGDAKAGKPRRKDDKRRVINDRKRTVHIGVISPLIRTIELSNQTGEGGITYEEI